jgi:hypothetical protein
LLEDPDNRIEGKGVYDQQHAVPGAARAIVLEG